MTPDEMKSLIKRMAASLRDREWMTRNAGENSYCPDCAQDCDDWRDMEFHRNGCPFFDILKEADNA